MNRQQLEHILRAAAAITGSDEFIVIGSQAILGAHPDAPPELLQSFDADLYSRRSNEDTDLIDGSIGEGSPFHRTFGYYAHGVAATTAKLPPGWEDRLVAVRGPDTRGATGLCIEPHDLAVSKIVAGRRKDLAFVAALFHHHLIDLETILSRIQSMRLDGSAQSLCEARAKRLSGAP